MPRSYKRNVKSPIFKLPKDEFVAIDSNKKIKEIIKQKKSPKYTGIICKKELKILVIQPQITPSLWTNVSLSMGIGTRSKISLRKYTMLEQRYPVKTIAEIYQNFLDKRTRLE